MAANDSDQTSECGNFALVGDIPPAMARTLADALRAGGDPAWCDPGRPWAACVLRDDGHLVATCSPMFHSGLFWSIDEATGDLVVATDPGRVISARSAGTALDAAYIVDYLAMRPPAEGTPYREIRRLPPGVMLVWSKDRRQTPIATTWSGPETWPTPFRCGPSTPGEYLEVFDAAVARAMPERGPLVLALSGGLDSTFLAASLARATTEDRPVIGLVHRPARAADCRPDAISDADEFPLAQALAAHHPGRLVVEPITNDAGILGLDTAMSEARRGWLPATNPCNTVWLTAIRDRAEVLGADCLFTGATGNYSFSSPHRYARPQSGPARVARRVRGLGRALHRHGSAATARRAWAAARRIGTSADDGTRDYVRLMNLPVAMVGRTRRLETREAYVEHLADRGTSFMGADNPRTTRGLLPADPFESPAVLRFAAEITPAEWLKTGQSRGYARLLSQHRVPDEIRLRTRRGQQAADAWWAASKHRDRYLADAQALLDTPVLADLIDVGALRTRMARWQWGQPVGPPRIELLAVERLLHTAEFLRWVAPHLAPKQEPGR